ncbi:phage terminase large subunit [Caulobacter sp. D4A]|uniref:phage terminase large subunit n=1 Tax=Caulobacter sp. D4A TaxID=2204171 RepID=UPI001304A44D|nr:phage terminase large subunit [Caulobacter sp. D4A]
MLSSKEILQADFLKFVWYVWTRVLSLPKPTRIQLDIALYLATGPRRRFIQAFRGIGKTFLTAAYVVWRLWKNPQLKIMIVSANETFATEIATFIKLIIEADPMWAELRPRIGQRSSAMAFDVGGAVETPDKSPSVKAVGITGQLTGSRADILISDDVEVPKNSETETMREKLEAKTGEYTAILKTTEEAEIIYLGTPQSQESIYRRLPEKGYGVRIWPARYPLASKIAAYLGHLAPMLLADIEADPELCKPSASSLGGKPTDPERFTEMQLMEREVEYRQAPFLLQYMLDTSLSDANKFPLKTRDLVVMDVHPKIAPVRLAWAGGREQVLPDLVNVGFDGDRFCKPMFVSPDWVDYSGSVMHIDPSGRGKDETGYVVTKFLHGQIYVRQWGGFTEGYSEATLQALSKIAADEGVNKIVVESNFGDGMFCRLLEPVLARVHPCAIEEVRSSGQKELRMLGVLEPVLAQHRLVMDSKVVERDLAHPELVRRGLYQLTHLTAQRGALKHDDRIDVLSLGVAYWTQYLNADQQKAQEAYDRKQNERWEKQFFAGTILGGNLKKPGAGPRRGAGRRMR